MTSNRPENNRHFSGARKGRHTTLPTDHIFWVPSMIPDFFPGLPPGRFEDYGHKERINKNRGKYPGEKPGHSYLQESILIKKNFILSYHLFF